ncbi:hypothetical protein KZ483_18475 [Paenibacillus sp. sptzw28]|uniref:hypothetical protein n=1 Tax=Paenibacillus sp. sptzw28 TaxID=715179 RepID=UPI001C6E30FA|nr:hypothetical protein [Paenibacillus sp. sptzw28]QYR19851.1 hypothetical protein KZ483_18475 [Paenibacillus sp. sptzw28]
MGTFLDQRSSMNANATGSILVEVTGTPALFGVVGLQTQNVANPIVDLAGTIGLSAIAGITAAISVHRGTLATSPAIYTAIYSSTVAGPVTFNFNAQDLLAPAALQTAYSAFVSSVSVGAVTRIGPEVFWGIASSTV